ncbi:MAG: hypothetical protein ACYCY0_04455 [Acidithiobacillus ferrivorans]
MKMDSRNLIKLQSGNDPITVINDFLNDTDPDGDLLDALVPSCASGGYPDGDSEVFIVVDKAKHMGGVFQVGARVDFEELINIGCEDHLMSEHQSSYINGEISLTTGELTWLDEFV